MNKEEIKSLKAKIIERIAHTKEEIEKLEEMTKPISPENSIGRVSRMDAINNKSVAEAALRSSKRKLNNLNLALHKVETPGFGTCTRCKGTIQTARLMYMPESARCIRCADR